MHHRDFPPDYRAALAEHDLFTHGGLVNYYLDHPEELRLAHLRHPETMDGLVAVRPLRSAIGAAGVMVRAAT